MAQQTIFFSNQPAVADENRTVREARYHRDEHERRHSIVGGSVFAPGQRHAAQDVAQGGTVNQADNTEGATDVPGMNQG